MLIEIDVHNPEHFGEILCHACANASPQVRTPWEHLPKRIKSFWGEVAGKVMLSAMGSTIISARGKELMPGEVLVLINAEFISARHEFPPLNSAHEAFVIHLEEVYALRNVVVKNQAMPERRVVLKGSIERRAKITAL